MAQPTDNTLGAPTEGLGQNVTFSYANETGVPQLEAGDPGRIRAGVVGGPVGVGSTRAQGVAAPGPNATLEMLLKVGDSLLKPVIEKRKTEAYVSGMQRAMQGEAVTDIANSRPWYSKIAGEVDVIEGARAYTGNTVAQTTVAAMEDKMPEIRQMDGATAQKFFVDSINGAKTGDAATDLSIMQSLTRTLPGFMKRQAKEHYAWKQERFSAAEDTSFKSSADGLQRLAEAAADNGITTPEDIATKAKQFVVGQVPAAGRDEKQWKIDQTRRYLQAAKLGQFHVLNAAGQPIAEGAPSLLETLEPEQQTAILAAREAGEANVRAKYSMQWSDQLAKVEAQAAEPPTGTTTQQLADQIDNMNAAYKTKTGASQPFILPRERAAILSRSTTSIARDYAQQARDNLVAAEKLGAAQGKAAEAAKKVEFIQGAISKGRVGTLAAAPGYSTEEINAEVISAFKSAPSVDAQQALLIRMHGTSVDGVQVGDGYVAQPIAKQMQANLDSVLDAKELTDQVLTQFADAEKLLIKSEATFDKYYGPRAAALSGYLNDVKNGALEAGAFVRHFVDPKPASLKADDMKDGIAALSKDYDSFGSSLGFGKKLKPGQARQWASAIGETASQFAASGNGDVKEAFVRASKSRADVEVAGGYVFRNSPKQKSLKQYITSTVGPAGERPIGSDDADEAFDNAVQNLLYGEGDTSGVLASKAKDVFVYRLRDDSTGVPQFTLAANVDGDIKRAHLSAKDIYKLSDRKRTKAKAKATALVVDNSREAQAEALYQSVIAPQQ